jgi:hypothetical protein
MPERFFLCWRQVGIPQDMDNTATLDNTIRADHLCHGQHRSDLHNGDTGLLELGCDRSAAASGRASRRGQNDRIDPLGLKLLGNLTTQPAAVGQRIG